MKLKKFIKWSLILLTSIVVISISAFVIIMETSADKYISDESKNEIISAIQQTEILPDNFLMAYEKVNPRSLTGNYWGYAFELLIFENSQRQCPCSRIALLFSKNTINYSRGFHKLVPSIIGLELEDHVTQKECLSFMLNEFDFTHGVIGVNNAAYIYYNKKIEDLNNDELAGLLTRFENPVLYNIRSRPDFYYKKKDEILQILSSR